MKERFFVKFARSPLDPLSSIRLRREPFRSAGLGTPWWQDVKTKPQDGGERHSRELTGLAMGTCTAIRR
jgi:hypothetical protein